MRHLQTGVTMIRYMFILLIATACIAASPATPELKSPAARSAFERCQATKRKALDTYLRAEAAAEKQFIEDLDKAKAIAAKQAQAEEIVAIAAVRDEAQARLDLILGQLNGISVKVAANGDWQRVTDVETGQRLKIVAKGKWIGNPKRDACGPDGFGEWYYLEGRIGGGEAFKIGPSSVVEASAAGALEMRMHDDDQTDNRGELDVSVSVEK
jgi:hypothetical protein